MEKLKQLLNSKYGIEASDEQCTEIKESIVFERSAIDLMNMSIFNMFIFERLGKVKILDYEGSKALKDKLIKQGWEYTGSLSPFLLADMMTPVIQKKLIQKAKENALDNG